MSYIGNLPFGKTLRTVTSITADGVATTFYPDGGYDVNFVDVFVSGARLSSGLDFTAADGISVTLLFTPVNGDIIDIVSYGLLELIDPVFPSTLGVGSNVVINTSSISVGNATGNVTISQSGIVVGNTTVGTVNTFAINVGANVRLSTSSIVVGNSTVNTYITSASVLSNTITAGALIQVSSQVALNTSSIVVGNSTSNSTANSTTFIVGNSTVNAFLTASQLSVGANVVLGTGTVKVGNSTGNVTISQSGIVVGNTTVGTVNAFAINVGANVNLSTSQISVGNSTVNTTITSNNIFTSGTITGRIQPRVNTTTANTGTYSIDTDLYDTFIITGQTVAITSITATGTPVDSQKLWVAITSTNTSINFSTANFEATTIALPTTVVASTRLDVGFIWNTTTSKWRCVATA